MGFVRGLSVRRAWMFAALVVACGFVGSATVASASLQPAGVKVNPSGPFALGKGGFRPSAVSMGARSLRVPGGRGQSPVTTVGGEVPWLRRADADTFMAGSGRLMTKIYPFAVNYRTASGAFSPIDNQLVASGSGYAQKANDLGVLLPGTAAGQAKVSDSSGSLAFGLSGATGTGSVSGAVEKFSAVSPGVDLRYSSLNSGIGWEATVSGAAASHGLSWVLNPSSGLTAKLVSGGVAFENAAGKRVWMFAAPTARAAGSSRPLPLRVSLSNTAKGTVITVAPSSATGAPAATPATASRGVVHSAAVTSGSSVTWDGLVVPGTFNYLGSGVQTGDCYLDSGSPDTSFCLGDTNYVGPNNNALINFDVTDNLPQHVQVLQSFAVMELSSQDSGTAESVEVSRASKPWTNAATWNSYDGITDWDTHGGDTTGPVLDKTTLGSSSDVGNQFYWNIDDAMQHWVDGNPQEVDGLEFSATAGSSAPNTLGFATETDPDNAPYLSVYYEQRMGDYPGAKYDSQKLTDRSSLGVNVATGNLLVSNTDLNLTGVKGLNVNVGRYYNNLSADQDSFGTGWSMGTGADTYLAIPSDDTNTLDYFDGTGNAQVFHDDTTGQPVAPPGMDVKVSMNDSSAYSASQFTLLFRHSGITEKFDAPDHELDKIAQLSSISDRNGNTIHYYYNTSGQLDHLVDSYGATTSFTYSTAGYVSEITDPTGRVYQYFQNSAGQLTQYEDPAGNSTYYAYDDYGNLTTITTAQGNITTVDYDAGNTNEVTAVTRYVDPTDTSGPQTTYQFATASGTCPSDDGSIQGTVRDPNAHVSTYCTDDHSRITKSVDANGHSRSVSYRSTDGFVDTLTSALSTPTAFTYDDATDNVKDVTQGSGTGSLDTHLDYTDATNPYLPTEITDPQSNSVANEYDSNGNMTKQTDGLSSQNQATKTYNTGSGTPDDGTVKTSTDADNNETDYHYTDHNLTQIVPPTGSQLNTINLTYDSANRVKTISTVSGTHGREVDYTYDDFDRVTTAVYKNASGTTVETICYGYDDDGNLTSRTDSAGTTTYHYDGINRLVNQSFPDSSYDNYGYDSAGNLITLNDAGGTVDYYYDKANQLTSVYDPGASKPAATMTYDNDGNRLATNYQSGASVVNTYNTIDQLTKVTDTYKTSSGTNTHLSYTYTYAGSLRHTVTDQDGNVTTYSYDPLNRLYDASTAGGPAGSSDYHYTIDGNGNLTKIQTPSATTTYTYNAGNEICWSKTGTSSAGCGSAPSGANSYGYDVDGDQTSDGNGLTATYNELGQTTSITQGSTTTDYSYLGEGQKELIADGTNTLHNDNLGLASRQDGTGTDYYTRTPDGQQIDERTPSGTFNYLYDGNGSIVGLTNSSDHLVNHYTYDPYGNQNTLSSSAPNHQGFQDGYQTSGQIHFGQRYLNPTDARWTQQDPMQHINSLTQNNRYEFAGDNPITNADPNGQDILDDIGDVASDAYQEAEDHVGGLVAIGSGVVIGGITTVATLSCGGAAAASEDPEFAFTCAKVAGLGYTTAGTAFAIGGADFIK
jgi:RHS repeat-associated protein